MRKKQRNGTTEENKKEAVPVGISTRLSNKKPVDVRM
jgi:hypothetical protein